MYDFPTSMALQGLIRDMHEGGRIVASVCHGYAGLLDVTLSDGTPFVAGRKLTGFSWNEEVVAGVSKKVPYNVEERITELGADCDKALLPMVPHVVEDGTLITGQNPTSAKGTGEAILKQLQIG